MFGPNISKSVGDRGSVLADHDWTFLQHWHIVTRNGVNMKSESLDFFATQLLRSIGPNRLLILMFDAVKKYHRLTN